MAWMPISTWSQTKLTPQAFQCRHAMEHNPEDAANGRRRRRLVLPEGVVENMLMLVEWFLGATPSWQWTCSMISMISMFQFFELSRSCAQMAFVWISMAICTVLFYLRPFLMMKRASSFRMNGRISGSTIFVSAEIWATQA